jgi:multiple antibiotic resistance protein
MIKLFLTAFTAQFVALDIIGTVPIYFTLTQMMDRSSRNSIVNKSMVVAAVVAVGFIFLGQTVFRHLGVEIFDFKIAGGIVLLLTALADLVGGPHAIEKPSGSTGIVPLAVPLISGPAVLTTLVIQIGVYGYVITLLALILNYLIAWLILRNSDFIKNMLGKDGSTALSKIAALLLAAISIAMIRNGVFEAIAYWK